jgi:hypothetical protein
MPYSSSTGCSGVAHLACAYGVPVVCADLEDFRQMSDGEGMAIEFYKPGDAKDLAACLVRFLSDPVRQQVMAEQNFSAALRMTMPNIVLKYLRHFELEHRTLALRHVTRFRKLPSWVPSKSLLLRLMTRRSLGWVHRSALHRPPVIASNDQHLLNNHFDGGGKLAGGRTPVNGNGVTGRSRSSGNGSVSGSNGSSASARSAKHSQPDDGTESDQLCPALARPLAQEDQAHEPERQ